ncbi:MAG: alkaline phosphatase family protein, partial [Angustibacter sp.]
PTLGDPTLGDLTLGDPAPGVLPVSPITGPAAAADGRLRLPAADRVCVLLVDGLGELLLRERAGHAPFLRAHLDQIRPLNVGFPSTTATSMGSFGTGLPPGRHGLVGYQVLVPDQDRLINQLSWEPPVDPRQWQPAPTVFQSVAAAGVEVVRIGPGFFDGSGLTEAALRGGRFVAAESLDDRVDAALVALRSSRRALVYVYWGELDKVGHVSGCASWEWGDELAAVDGAVRRLAAGLPRGTVLHITADHGMVDVPHRLRVDIAGERQLGEGIRHLGGEPRCVQLYCEAGATASVVDRWSDRLGSAATVMRRADAVAAGWFGPVADHVLGRIGDVVVVCGPDLAVVDSDRMRPQLLSLIGLHGGWTPQESRIPLLTVES